MLDMGPEMTGLLRNVLEESEADRPFHEDLIRLWLAQIVILLLRQLGVMEHRLPPPDGDRDGTPDIIDNYFETNLAQNPCADDLADRLHISRRHLNRILQKTYGMSFRDKLLRARMDRAAWLLRHSENSVSAIAGEVGYTYDPAFRQAFRERFGMTPLEYRQQTRKDEPNESHH
jgi:AraC-like DNA-binding protein